MQGPAFRIQKIFVLLSFFVFCRALAQVDIFSEESALIMAVQLRDGTSVSPAMDIFRINNQWHLPLGSLMDSLKVQIQISPALGKAEGFYLSDDHPFNLDQKNCLVQNKNIKENYPCQDVQIFNDDIYVTSNLLEKWFQIKFNINSFSSEIQIDSPRLFPDQERRERSQRSIGSRESSNSLPRGYVHQDLNDEAFGNLVIDEQLTASVDKTGQQTQGTFSSDSIIATEIQGFETKYYLGISNSKLQDSTLNFTKKRKEANLLGPLKSREIQLNDLNVPNAPMVTGSTRGKGFLISNYDFTPAQDFSLKDFRGPLPSGWEVELYQNDLLVGKKSSDVSTQYEFKEIPLFYGVNYFRLIFYGPQGQKKEENQVINVDSNMMKPGNFNYRISAAQHNDYLDQVISSIQFQQGLTTWASVGLGHQISKPSKEDSPISYEYLQGVFSIDRLMLTTNLASNSENGTAAEFSSRMPFQKSSLGASISRFSKYRSVLFEKQNNSFISESRSLSGRAMPFNFLTLQLSAEYRSNLYENGFLSKELLQKTMLQTGEITWFNNLAYVDSNEVPVGDLNAISTFRGFEFRPHVTYEREVNQYGLNILYRLSKKTSLESSYLHNISEDRRIYKVAMNREFDVSTLSMDLETQSNGSIKASALVSFSAVQKQKTSDVYFQSSGQTGSGAAKVFVYFDANQNSIFDDGDQPLPNIELLVNQNNVETKTDSEGNAFLMKLPTYQNIDVSIAHRSLTDPFHRPVKKGIRIFPRPGNPTYLEFPIILLSEMDGTIQVAKDGRLKPKKGLEMRLLNAQGEVIKSVKSESDGYYFFDEIKPGNYVLTPNPDQIKEMGLTARPKSIDIMVPVTGLFNSRFDITLSPVKNP